VLSERSTHAMQETQITLPRIGTSDQAWGLGWAIYNLDGGGQIIGHDGGTIGQGAFFRMAPEHGLAIAVLANGGNMGNVWREIYARVLHDLTGLDAPPEAVPDPAATIPDTSRFVGKYSNAAEDNLVRVDEDGRVFLDYVPKGISAELGEQPETIEMLPYSGNALISAKRYYGSYSVVTFLADEEGRTQYMYESRISRRVSE
jgi:hypothetical protein